MVIKGIKPMWLTGKVEYEEVYFHKVLRHPFLLFNATCLLQYITSCSKCSIFIANTSYTFDYYLSLGSLRIRYRYKSWCKSLIAENAVKDKMGGCFSRQWEPSAHKPYWLLWKEGRKERLDRKTLNAAQSEKALARPVRHPWEQGYPLQESWVWLEWARSNTAPPTN